MGDRCSCFFYVHVNDLGTFLDVADVGVAESLASDNWYRYDIEEITLDELDQLLGAAARTGCRFAGGHGQGDDYGPEVFACDGEEFCHVRCDHQGNPMVRYSAVSEALMQEDMSALLSYFQVRRELIVKYQLDIRQSNFLRG